VNRTGLGGAVIEGWISSSADLLAVIDGDLQHDETFLPKMYGLFDEGRCGLAIGTRLESGNGLSPARQKLSDLGRSD
jgi:dolichol-phosphate mannosyltransferase